MGRFVCKIELEVLDCDSPLQLADALIQHYYQMSPDDLYYISMVEELGKHLLNYVECTENMNRRYHNDKNKISNEQINS